MGYVPMEPSDELESLLRQTRTRKRNNEVFLCTFVAGLCALGCYLYDLVFPGHFVGDMYGLEVMMRLVIVAGPTAGLFIGGSLLYVIGDRERKWPRAGAGALLVASAIGLVLLAYGVGRSRW